MGIIQKRADELKPGDVLNIGSQQHAVLFVEISGQNVGYQAIPIAGGEQDSVPALRHCHASYTFSVASPDLTPAQQHAEELAELVREMSQPDFPGEVGAGSACGRARALLDKIKPPEPPTLAEMLEVVLDLRKCMISGCSLAMPAGRADDLLDRARRAGVLKEPAPLAVSGGSARYTVNIGNDGRIEGLGIHGGRDGGAK